MQPNNSTHHDTLAGVRVSRRPGVPDGGHRGDHGLRRLTLLPSRLLDFIAACLAPLARLGDGGLPHADRQAGAAGGVAHLHP